MCGELLGVPVPEPSSGSVTPEPTSRLRMGPSASRSAPIEAMDREAPGAPTTTARLKDDTLSAGKSIPVARSMSPMAVAAITALLFGGALGGALYWQSSDANRRLQEAAAAQSAAISQRDSAQRERDSAIEQRDAARKERDKERAGAQGALSAQAAMAKELNDTRRAQAFGRPQYRGVLTIENPTSNTQHYKLKWVAVDATEGGWEMHDLKPGQSRKYWFLGAIGYRMEFDFVAGDGSYTPKAYFLDVSQSAVDAQQPEPQESGKKYYLKYDSSGKFLDLTARP